MAEDTQTEKISANTAMQLPKDIMQFLNDLESDHDDENLNIETPRHTSENLFDNDDDNNNDYNKKKEEKVKGKKQLQARVKTPSHASPNSQRRGSLLDAILNEDSQLVIENDAIDNEEEKKDKEDINLFRSLTNLIANITIQPMESQKTIIEVMSTSNDTLKLPELSGWLLKSSTRLGSMRIWQKRWICVKGLHMLWSKSKQTINDPSNAIERKKWQNSITLLVIIDVKKINSTKGREFDVVTRNKTYYLRAYSKQDRDHWVEGLKEHLRVLNKSMNFLNESALFGKSMDNQNSDNKNNNNNDNNDNNNNNNNDNNKR